MNTTRIGKIARLPREVREVLGDRLAAGEPAGTLIGWLNGLACVQGVLRQYFGSRLITEQNLSEWRQGGHQDWLRREEARVLVGQLAEQGEDLAFAAQGQEISDRLARRLEAALVRLAEVLVDREAEPLEQWRQLREVNRELSRLRRDDHQAAQVELQRQRLEFEVARANGREYELPDRRMGNMRTDPATSQYLLNCLERQTQEHRAGTDRFVPVIEEEEEESENSQSQNRKFKDTSKAKDQAGSGGETGEVRPNPSESDLSNGDAEEGGKGGNSKSQKPKFKEHSKSKDQAKGGAEVGQNQVNPSESDLSNEEGRGTDGQKGTNGTEEGGGELPTAHRQ